MYLFEFIYSYHYWQNYILFSIRKKHFQSCTISMYNVNPKRQGGVGGGEENTGRSKNVGQFFGVGTKDKFNKCG